MMPASAPIDGARALAQWALSLVAGRLGWERVAERARAPQVAMAEMQPVASAWWRERRTQRGMVRYLALGDSTGQGIGASSPGRSYVGQLIARLEQATGERVKVVNLAVSGATTSTCVRDQLPKARRVLAYDPHVVTLAIGANDIAEWDPVVFHRNMTALLDALPARTLVGEVPCFHLPHGERRVAEANRILHRIAAARGHTVVPLHEATRRRGLRGVLTEFAIDAFHPNDRGYQVWADAFWPFVRARLAAARSSEPA